MVLAVAGGSAGWAWGDMTVDTAAAPTVTVTATPFENATADASTSDVAAVTAPDIEVDAQATEVSATPVLILDEPDSTTVIVNKERPLDPLDYAPADLVTLSSLPDGAGERLREGAAAALTAMHAAAAADGAGFRVASAYRSYAEQRSLFSTYASRRSASSAERFSARGGYSEHQTGLAVDVYQSVGCRLKPCFATEAAGAWVAQHGWEYGFIVRYPEGQTAVTGYTYEPWHLRYVGEDVAAAMREEGAVTLEDFLGLSAAPDYE